VKVKDAMHKGVDWVSPDTPVTELAKLMCEHDIGAIPIGENDRLIGMVTDRDIVCKGLAQDSFDVRRATARDVMTPGIHCCRDDDDLVKAVRHMEKLQVRTLPVINKSRRMIGILSLGDISNSAPGDLLSECVRACRLTTESRVMVFARRKTTHVRRARFMSMVVKPAHLNLG
jgi:CBS-domain-containing membrane protein